MSSLTTCNFCTVNQLRDDAYIREEKIVLIHEERGAYNVYCCPLDIVIPKSHKHKEDSTESFDAYWIMWLGGISRICCCDD